jgi:hypothetical protein
VPETASGGLDLGEDLSVTEMRAIAAIDTAQRALVLAKRVGWIGAIALILVIVALVHWSPIMDLWDWLWLAWIALSILMLGSFPRRARERSKEDHDEEIIGAQ